MIMSDDREQQVLRAFGWELSFSSNVGVGKLKSWFVRMLMVSVIFVLGGCQLADVARFTYANATATHQWQGESQTTTLPFELVDDHIILAVSLNGSEPLKFVLDSGAAATVILQSRATNSLDLEMAGELAVSGVGTGPDPVAHIVEASDLSVGEINIQGLSLVYLPLESVPFFENLDEVYFDGVIGAHFLERFVVEIDYDKQLISFSEPDSKFAIAATDDAKWDELPLQITGGLPYLTTNVGSFSGQEVSVRLLVDTGYRGPVSLTPDSHNSIEPPREFFSMVGQGLSGDVEINVGITESFHLGSTELNNLPVSYSIQGGESDDDSNGLLGNEVLRRFNIVFDYPNERMLVSPNDSFVEQIHADRSGLLIRPHRWGGVVKSIAPGSAAANTKLQVGDIITSINDDAMTHLSIMELKTQLASDQDTVTICWSSGIESQCDHLSLASRFN